MDFVTFGSNPWGQPILTHISWNLLWVSFFAGFMFLVAHATYMVLSAHRKRPAAETDALEAKHKNLPEHIERHSLMARLFHWVMAGSMFVLLITAFFPIAGIQFPWVTWHWVGRPRAHRVGVVPHHPRHLLAGLLVDLGRSPRHSGIQSGDSYASSGMRSRARSPASIRSGTGCTTWRSSSWAPPSS